MLGMRTIGTNGTTNAGRLAALAVASALSGAGGSAALAEPLAPGATLNLGGTTPGVSPWLNGVSPAGAALPFSIQNQSGVTVMSGTLLLSYVDASPFARRYALIRVQGLTGFPGRSITKIETAGWGDHPAETEFRVDIDPIAAIPEQAIRSADGDTIAFTFGAGGVPPPMTSKFVYVFTDAAAVEYTGTARIVLNTGESATVTGIPVPAAPAVCAGDSNGDGVINFADLNGVLSNFGEECD